MPLRIDQLGVNPQDVGIQISVFCYRDKFQGFRNEVVKDIEDSRIRPRAKKSRDS